MLQSHTGKTSTVKEHGFLIAVELEDWQSPEKVADKFAEAVTWVEGVGRCEVTHMGVLEPETDESL